MAIRRTSNNSINNAVKLSTGFASAAIPNTPTIGVATAVSDVAATVEYTAAVLGATASTFTATSNPGSVTGTGSSPITVTGLTASTAYTFTVTAGNANGTSAASSASNSITTSAPLNSYESIATVTVGSGGQTTVEFTSIPSTYTHLQIRWLARQNTGSVTGGNENIRIRFNSDAGNNYSIHRLYGTGASVSADGYANQTDVVVNGFAGNGDTAQIYGAGVCDILDYANTNKYKTIRYFGGVDTNGAGYAWFGSGSWRNTNAITTIQLRDDTYSFKQYSQFALYGIRNA